MTDLKNRGNTTYTPKHAIQVVETRYWLSPCRVIDQYRHPRMTTTELLAENQRCWDQFYSLREIAWRLRHGVGSSWPLAGKLTYVVLSLVFKRVYKGHGVSADCVQKKKGMITKILINLGASIYSHFFRQKTVGLRVPLRN